ncbi:MAG: hypothetical protein MI923_14440 [Phycisphaerales bacterium]|nr:hypothetical protein [Phycisphaerales bacterium]
MYALLATGGMPKPKARAWCKLRDEHGRTSLGHATRPLLTGAPLIGVIG